MQVDDFLTARRIKAIAGPASDPGLALAHAAHLLLEVSQVPQLESKVSSRVIEIVRAHMRRLDPEWSTAISGLGTQILMSLPSPMRLRAEFGALAHAGLHGFAAVLQQTFKHLESMMELVHQLDKNACARELAAIVLCAPLPETLGICEEWRIVLAQAMPEIPNSAVDYRLHAYFTEGAVLNELWVPVDEAAERLCVGQQRIHRWIREGGLDARPERGRQRRTVCLGALCTMTRARWLLPFHIPEPVANASFTGGNLTFMRNLIPAILDNTTAIDKAAVPSGLGSDDVVGSLVWTSPIAGFNASVHRLSEDWVQDQAQAPVAIHHVIDEVLHDPAGKPFAHRSLSVVTRRSIGDALRTTTRQRGTGDDTLRPGIPVDPHDPKTGPDDETDEAESFPEGRVVYRKHRTYERSGRLRELAKRQALEKYGRIACIVCGFDFAAVYGALGEGFIECHHTKPVSELPENATTKLEDIALLCANCHRMVHRRRPWLSRAELPHLLPQRLPRS